MPDESKTHGDYSFVLSGVFFSRFYALPTFLESEVAPISFTKDFQSSLTFGSVDPVDIKHPQVNIIN